MTMHSEPIIDSHYHLWDLGQAHYPWLESRPPHIGDLSKLRQNYLPEDYRRDIGRWNIVGAVNVEAGYAEPEPAAESRWLSSTLNGKVPPSVFVAFVDLTRADSTIVLAKQAQIERVRGIRMRFRDPAELGRNGADSVLSNPNWWAAFALLRDYGFSFDLQAPPDLATAAAEIAARFPEIQLVLTHAGLPLDRSGQGMAKWRQGLRLLAGHANVACKISGLAMIEHDWRIDRLREIILPVLDAFGPSRCMIGSNFPVDRLFRTFDQIFTTYSEILQVLGAADRQAVFHDTASRIYRLTTTSP